MGEYRIINELKKHNRFTYDKCNIEVYNISGKFKDDLDNAIYLKQLELLKQNYIKTNTKIELLPVDGISSDEEDRDPMNTGNNRGPMFNDGNQEVEKNLVKKKGPKQ